MSVICVIGTGYVGLVTGTCFADMGNQVTCVDILPEKIERLRQGILPIYEPGLEEMVERNVQAGRLRFTTSYSEGLDGSEYIFIAVNTPTGANQGGADMRYVESAARGIAEELDHPAIIINKSTVPVGSGDVVSRVIRENLKRPDVNFAVVSNPEFLREGAAIGDFLNPDRVVLGSSDPEAANKVALLYLPLRSPIITTDLYTAEMIKYASNAFLATKISFINEIAQICERLGADVKEVAVGMGHDKRIGRAFLDAGLGYGGSCFEADETVFALNSPNVATERLDTLFEKGGIPFQGDVVELVQPNEQQVLAFDLETGEPTLAEVKAITRRPYTGIMVRIETSMGRTLRVTADHPVIVYRDQQFHIMPAAAIATGDRLMTLCELPTITQTTHLHLIDLLRGTDLADDISVKAMDNIFSEQYEQFAAAIPQELLKRPYEIKRSNRMPLRLFHHLSDAGVLNVPAEKLTLYKTKNTSTAINALIPVNAELLRLCGYYLAQGYLAQEKKNDVVREPIHFSFPEQETEYSVDVRRILQNWGITFRERHNTDSTIISVSSPIFTWLLRDTLRCGTRAEDKALPRLVFNVPEALRAELMRGAFSNDRAMTTIQDGEDMTVEYATVSKALADGMTLLLQTVDIIPSIHTIRLNKARQEAYILRISGYEQVAALKNVLHKKHHVQVEQMLSEKQPQASPRGYKRHGAFATLVVREVEHTRVQTTVYSLETTTGTLIASSGLISHNCFPKDVRALAYMGEEAGLHPQLLHAVMEINQDQRNLLVTKLTNILGSLRGCTIGILGLAFKPNTDDMREAPAIDIIRWITAQGATVRVYDPVAMETGREALKREGVRMDAVTFCESAYDAATGVDALAIVTEWNEFKALNIQQIHSLMRRPILIDGRNIYEPAQMNQAGFIYRGIGRGTGPAPSILPPSDSTSIIHRQQTLGLEEGK